MDAVKPVKPEVKVKKAKKKKHHRRHKGKGNKTAVAYKAMQSAQRDVTRATAALAKAKERFLRIMD
jgi:hypothetical protein